MKQQSSYFYFCQSSHTHQIELSKDCQIKCHKRLKVLIYLFYYLHPQSSILVCAKSMKTQKQQQLHQVGLHLVIPTYHSQIQRLNLHKVTSKCAVIQQKAIQKKLSKTHFLLKNINFEFIREELLGACLQKLVYF